MFRQHVLWFKNLFVSKRFTVNMHHHLRPDEAARSACFAVYIHNCYCIHTEARQNPFVNELPWTCVSSETRWSCQKCLFSVHIHITAQLYTQFWCMRAHLMHTKSSPTILHCRCSSYWCLHAQHTCQDVCIYLKTYLCINVEREREREGGKKGGRDLTHVFCGNLSSCTTQIISLRAHIMQS